MMSDVGERVSRQRSLSIWFVGAAEDGREFEEFPKGFLHCQAGCGVFAQTFAEQQRGRRMPIVPRVTGFWDWNAGPSIVHHLRSDYPGARCYRRRRVLDCLDREKPRSSHSGKSRHISAMVAFAPYCS
jgi:hypothetical protein